MQSRSAHGQADGKTLRSLVVVLDPARDDFVGGFLLEFERYVRHYEVTEN